MADPIKLQYTGGHWYLSEVGWGGAKIVTIQFDIGLDAALPPMPLTPDATGLASFDLFTDPIKFGDGKPADVVNPFSKDMMRHLRIWNRSPTKFLTYGDHGMSHAGIGVLFMNLNRIRPLLDATATKFDFKIDFPASNSHTVTDTIYWVWSNIFASDFEGNLAFPFTTGDPVTHRIVVFPEAFSSSGDAADFMSHFTGSSMDGHMFQTTTTTPPRLVSDNRSAHVYVGTYKRDIKNNPTSPANTLDFPIDPTTMDPLWDVGTAVDAVRRGVTAGLNPLAYTLNFSIDLKTLKITADHPELDFDVGP